ncbi:NrdH-redoxin [Arthrobacter sp. PAMC25564]|uniref:glutaredoxin domain-containing protein n=1 Tax=Arthrobacter sp. PAMC25564 TaxID=2565366 RepID=UPI0010A29014|nr:glutaredoxin domain-containing protein [Arthrobacter sp. PAMC25564]QCB97140.1 NrdH-redoxin [Arthrobacter sp. PAMC25564]
MTHAHEIQAREGVATVVYTKPDCVQCTQTFRMLDRAGIYYTKVDVSQDETALKFIKALDYMQAPVVYVSTIDGDEHWSGFNPDLIKANITERADVA